MTTRVNRMTRGIIVEKLESADEGLWIFVDEGSFWVVVVGVVARLRFFCNECLIIFQPL